MRVARDPRTLADMLPKALRRYPAGLIVEEFVAGTDVTVPFLEGAGDEGVLLPVDYVIEPAARSRFNIYDYRLKSAEAGRVAVRCPPTFSATVVARLRAICKLAVRTLGVARYGPRRFSAGRRRPHLFARGQRSSVAGTRVQHLRRGGARGLDYQAALGAGGGQCGATGRE